jgi:hypothetical protein
MVQILIRFLVGGAVLSVFAAIGDVLRPKSFAGLFGAAPSVALATLGCTTSLRVTLWNIPTSSGAQFKCWHSTC